MIAGSRRPLLVTSLAAFAVLVLFIASGLLVRQYVASAFAASQRLHEIRLEAQSALKLQLDEETGIRGFAATGDRVFLQPYLEAQTTLTQQMGRLASDLSCCQLEEARPMLADARTIATSWNGNVAVPIASQPRANAIRIEKLGKQLIDRYRADFDRIDAVIDGRERAVAGDVQQAIDRINLVVVFFALVLAAATVLYVFQQRRVAMRLVEQSRIAEEERRQRAELRIAYDTEKRIADTLQAAFTQQPLPQLETLQFSASYVAATESSLVGGDWYDVMALSRNRVLFTIGDVTGHGIEAAVLMNRTRQAVISAALAHSDPAAILSRVNATFDPAEERLVTAIVGIADPQTFEFTYAAAGHPPPLLVEPGRAPQFLACGSLPLGASASARYETTHMQSLPGATLVLYTDGAVEHSRNVFEGEELLARAAAGARDERRSDPASYIHEAIFGTRAIGDDVAILTIGFSQDGALGLLISGDRAKTEFTGRIDQSSGKKAARSPNARRSLDAIEKIAS